MLTVDPAGNATVLWQFFPLSTGLPTGLQARHRTAAGAWGDTVFVATRPGAVLELSEDGLQLAADPAGNVTAIWYAASLPNYILRSARLPLGGAWSAQVNLSPTSGVARFPTLAVDEHGYATALWSGYQAGKHAVRSAVFDPVSPEMGEIDLPETAVAGQPVEMSVDPIDVWSEVKTTWDFGDGGKASGATVEHCFSAPGEQTVKATGTDAAANEASVEATIEIEPDPAVEEGGDPCSPPEPPEEDDRPQGPGAPAGPALQGPYQVDSLPSGACVVPRLASRSLPAAKRRLRAARCKLARVVTPRRHRGKPRRSLVVASRPRAGARPVNRRVHVTLGPRPRGAPR